MGLSGERWKAAMQRAADRFDKDESLKMLIKKYEDYLKRAQKVEQDIAIRRNEIAMEEVNKEIELMGKDRKKINASPKNNIRNNSNRSRRLRNHPADVFDRHRKD